VARRAASLALPAWVISASILLSDRTLSTRA
jgi:hypothetical protein